MQVQSHLSSTQEYVVRKRNIFIEYLVLFKITLTRHFCKYSINNNNNKNNNKQLKGIKIILIDGSPKINHSKRHGTILRSHTLMLLFKHIASLCETSISFTLIF